MNASLTRSCKRTPVDRGDRRLHVADGPDAERLEAVIAGDREGVAQRGGGGLGVQARGGLVEAVVGEGSAGSARPGWLPGPLAAAARAAACALAAVARSASSSRRLVEAIDVWPSRRQRISTLVSSIAVACVGAERA